MFSNNIVYLTERKGEKISSDINLRKIISLGLTPTKNITQNIN